MRIAIVGLGYVGVTAAACLAAQGHCVYGVDVNESKVKQINAGLSPISEPGVDELISKARLDGLLTATTSFPDDAELDLAIVCVGTPSAPNGSHNMGYVAESTRQIARAIDQSTTQGRITVAFRSTFRPGTMDTIIRPIFAEILGEKLDRLVELVYNPEFLRESSAIHDFRNPPKVVVGTVDARPSAVMDEMHEGLNAPVFNIGFREAEITKFVDNTWHAVKVAYANEVGRICAELDIKADVVHEIFVSDTKLNISPYYLRPGGAFGGSCLPKDVRAFQYIARDSRVQSQLINSLVESNESHKAFQFERVAALVEPGSTVLMIGLSFKAGTDDLRESPNVNLARMLIDSGYRLRVFEPALKPSALVGQNLGYTYSLLPEVSALLVEREALDPSAYDLVVVSNATKNDVDLSGSRVLDLGVI